MIIYLITTPNNHTYVGSSVDTVTNRMCQHRSKAKSGSTQKVHIAMREEGIEQCNIRVIEKGEWSLIEMKRKEDEWIAKLNPDLNVYKKSGSRGAYYTPVTKQEHRQQLIKILSSP